MDFVNVLNKVLREFELEQISYALIGGFALGIWGVVRATNDLDFLVDKEKQSSLKNILGRIGYKVVDESENVVQFEAEEYLLGSIDFLYSFREPSRNMLKRAVVKDILEGQVKVKVVIPEDIIGLKVQAIVNNPRRIFIDQEDIEQLMEKFGVKDLNWDLLKEHFLLFNKQEMFYALQEKYKK